MYVLHTARIPIKEHICDCLINNFVAAYFGKLIAKLRKKIAVRTDDRMRLMSEIVSGIQVIKMYAWEKPFAKLVEVARRYVIWNFVCVSYLTALLIVKAIQHPVIGNENVIATHIYNTFIFCWSYNSLWIAVAQWLRCRAANRKVAGSIPAGVIGFFIDIKSFRSHYGPGVDSASNRNEYQEHFLGVKSGRCVRLTTLPPTCAVVMKSGNLNFLEPCGPLQACNGTDLPFYNSLWNYSYIELLFILYVNPVTYNTRLFHRTHSLTF